MCLRLQQRTIRYYVRWSKATVEQLAFQTPKLAVWDVAEGYSLRGRKPSAILFTRIKACSDLAACELLKLSAAERIVFLKPG